MGHEYYLRRNDNKTLFELGKYVGDWIDCLGKGHPFLLNQDDEEALIIFLNDHIINDKWKLDNFPGGCFGYATMVAKRIIKWADNHEFIFIGENGYDDWFTGDPDFDLNKYITGSRYGLQAIQILI